MLAIAITPTIRGKFALHIAVGLRSIDRRGRTSCGQRRLCWVGRHRRRPQDLSGVPWHREAGCHSIKIEQPQLVIDSIREVGKVDRSGSQRLAR